MERRDSTEQVGLLCTLFGDDLSAQIAQIIAQFSVLHSKLLIESFLLSESSCEHVDLLAKLVIFKLILLGLTPDILVALLSQLLELAVFRLLKRLNHIVSLIELFSQVRDDAALIFFQVGGILLQIVHQTP